MDKEATLRLRRLALRMMGRAQKERSSLTRIGLLDAARRADRRVQEARANVQALTAVLS